VIDIDIPASEITTEASTPSVARSTKPYGTGRRKTAVARVHLTPGSGKITVNGREAADYFQRDTLLLMINQPFGATNQIDKWDVRARVNGGGLSGQAGALRHGISRALAAVNADLQPILRKAGLLTRDPRMVERKKYGQPGARKRFQFSKR